MNILLHKFKEVSLSVIPITIIVLILNFTIAPLENHILYQFLLGAVFVITGLSLFLFGVEIGITPIGNHLGSAISRTNRIAVVITAGIVLGFFISAAEPDLHILAEQVDQVTAGGIQKLMLVAVVSVGIAFLLTFGLIRLLKSYPLNFVLLSLYGIILVLSLFTSKEFLAIAFDASGATTGAMTVPFILALAMGISSLKKDSKASENDSFGLVAIASTGAILSVLLMSIISRSDTFSGSPAADHIESQSVFSAFVHELPILLREVAVALVPILLFFLFSLFFYKLKKKQIVRILKGLLYTYLGLVLFLTGVNAGFMEAGVLLGSKIAALDFKPFIVIIGFILGVVTILAEPAVYVLTHEIENVTSGYVKRKYVLISLCAGVGTAVALSMVRILVPEIQLWHYLLPGYVVCAALSFIVPKLFVGMAFDSGGVASGPMTATFILAFAQGAADSVESASVLVDGFGMIAMVALTPIIALQILGLIFQVRSSKRRKTGSVK